MRLAEDVYQFTSCLPGYEKFGWKVITTNIISKLTANTYQLTPNS